MRESAGFILSVLLMIGLAVFGITYYVHSNNDCNAKHGVLVHKANGFYACVDKGAIK